jgi:hypothetical protein
MLYIIITVLVLVGLVGFFRMLTTEERAIVTRGIINTLSFSSVYMFKASRASVKASYNIGEIAGMHLSLEGQETINGIHSYNTTVSTEGGAVKVAVRTADRHSDAIGATDALDHLAKYKAELAAKLELARTSRV